MPSRPSRPSRVDDTPPINTPSSRESRNGISTSPPPDGGEGGLVAWTQILAGVLINSLTWGYSASFGVYQLYYTSTLHLPPSQISWVGSLQVFLTFFIGAFSGRSADAGYALHTVALGSFLIVLGTFMTSLCHMYWQILLAQGICTGLGMGIMYMPAVQVIGSYWGKRRSMALGMAASGSGIGGIIFPLLVSRVQDSIGFPWAVRATAFIALLFAVLIFLLLRPRLPPRKSGPLVEWHAFLEPAYTLFTIGMFLVFWALYYVFFYINTYATQIIGLPQSSSSNLLIVVSAVGIPVRPLLGLFADRYFGVLNTLIACGTVLGIMLYTWIAVKSTIAMYVWAVIYGLATGATQGIFVGALASLTEDVGKMGTRFGMVCTILSFATLSGPPIAGALVQVNGGYVGADVWAGTVTIVGVGFVVAAAWYKRVEGGSKEVRQIDGGEREQGAGQEKEAAPKA